MMDPTSKTIARLAGFVLLVPGLGLTALAIWMLAHQLTLSMDAQSSALVGFATVAIVALVCCTLGFRLTFDRPNRYQSLLPPLGWYTLAFFFLVLGAALGYVVLRHSSHYTQLIGAACAILVAALCWKAGSSVRATPLDRQCLPT